MYLLSGTVVASAEAGPGVVDALVAGPEGSGVQPHKARKRKEGSVRSREARTGLFRVSYYKLEGEGQGFGGQGCKGTGLEHMRGKGVP